jgi:hypothetical protein
LRVSVRVAVPPEVSVLELRARSSFAAVPAPTEMPDWDPVIEAVVESVTVIECNPAVLREPVKTLLPELRVEGEGSTA